MIRETNSEKLDFESMESLLQVHHGDSRVLARRLPASCVDVTITSPPYFDMKDYGPKNQIGFGQDYESYLADLRDVFSEVRRATKDSGSLWIIIDSFRRDQQVVPLPFDLTSELKAVGWSLRDVIIWKKERTVPWVSKGTTRKIFEYILVFSKEKAQYKYFVDRIRDFKDLKKWWVRYPERYNPRGKAIEELWSYDIPTQGSWGNKFIRHFCPLPTDLVNRIVDLTTEVGDVVLAPFAGSGTVLTQASLRGRRFIGFELNHAYIKMFRAHLASETTQLLSSEPGAEISSDEFSKLIVNLRMLKYGRLLFRELRKRFGDASFLVVTRPVNRAALPPFKIQAAEYFIGPLPVSIHEEAAELLSKFSAKPPLSKFGIAETLIFFTSSNSLPKPLLTKRMYGYTGSNSHKFFCEGPLKLCLEKNASVVSTLRVQLEEEIG